MSTFLNIVRFDDNEPEGGMRVRLNRDDILAAAKRLPGYAILEEGKQLAVRLPGTGLSAVLEHSGVLSCQLAASSDIDLVIEVMRKLADEIPGAYVLDEEGDVY
jgi:hypothetical protein